MPKDPRIRDFIDITDIVVNVTGLLFLIEFFTNMGR